MRDLQNWRNSSWVCHSEGAGEYLVIIKLVSADICQNCGEYYLDDTVTKKVSEQFEDVVNLRYAA